jgi:acid phosphatase type 7
MKNRVTVGLAAAFVVLSGVLSPALCREPAQLWLGWRGDPTTTMVVRWLGEPNGPGSPEVVYSAYPDTAWQEASGVNHPMPHTDRQVNVVELVGLAPGRVYHFRVRAGTKTHRFRTMPASLDEPVRFIEGGDLYGQNYWYNYVNPLDGFGLFREGRMAIVRKVAQQAARRNPMFGVVGGDIAYTEGHPGKAERWYDWLAMWKEDMVTSDSLMVPLVTAIGNHEIVGNQTRAQWHTPGSDPRPAAHAPYYYSLFVEPDTVSYTTLDFGDYLSLILLDSGHSHTVAEQTPWLVGALADRADQAYAFAVYHVPAYPSYRSYDERLSRLVREHWVPLFETARITAAFEHHDHTYKRTVPILNGRQDPAGVLYVGDGAWGRLRRPVRPGDRWYLAKTAKSHHVYVTTLTESECRFEAIDEDGEVFDTFSRPVRPARARNE